MTTYTAIADADIDTDSPVTESLMTKLRDNPIAITEGASGAPQIVQAAIASGAIHTTQLDTSTGVNSTASTSVVNATLSGGTYSFFPQIAESGDGMQAQIAVTPQQPGASYVTNVAYAANTTGTAFIQNRYVNTSPPYDLGDGEIPLFIFAVIDNTTQEVISVSAAPDPVWVHNGPTDVYPDGHDIGGSYKMIRRLPPDFDTLPPQAKGAILSSAERQKTYITQAMKHADMDLLPHPWKLGNDLTGSTVVMLDPVSNTVLELAELMRAGENINEIIHNNYLNIGNADIGRNGPAGVLVPATTWK